MFCERGPGSASTDLWARMGYSKDAGSVALKKQLSPGRWRGLKNTSWLGDRFAVLAFDQRESYRKLLPPETTFQDAVQIKKEVVSALSPRVSSVLLDYVYGGEAAMELSNRTGLLVALEKSGYSGDSTYRRLEFDPEWNVAKIKRFGASAVKLLVYYNPDIANLAQEIERAIAEVVDASHQVELPVFVEPITYSADASVDKHSAEFAAQRTRLIVDTARRLSALHPDVLKLEFPIDIQYGDRGRQAWDRACMAVTEASKIPWVLLSAGVDFPDYERQLRAAVANGASGYMAGRTIWKESLALSSREREHFLSETAIPRIERLNTLVNRYATPWTMWYTYRDMCEGWYADYGD